MNRKTFLILVILILLLLGMFSLVYIQENNAKKNKLDRHAIAMTTYYLNIIATSLQRYAINYGLYNNLNEIVDKIQKDEEFPVFTVYGYDPEDKIFYDKWGNPIRLKIISHNEYCLISAGPNKIYEEGGGDDIAVKYDPMIEVEKYEKQKKQYK